MIKYFFSLAPLFFWAQAALAEVYFVPKTSGPSAVLISNLSAEEQLVWIQLKNSTSVEEVSYHIPARGSLNLKESDFSPQGFEYSIKSQSPALIVLRQTQDQNWLRATLQVSPHVFFNLKEATPASLQLAIQNQNFSVQTVQVRFLSSQKAFLGQMTLTTNPYFQTSLHELQLPADCRFIELIGEGRMNTQLKLQHSWISPEEILASKVLVPSDQVYFLLTNASRSDSFVVAMDNPMWIAQARDLIHSAKNNKILFGRIRADQNSWNRPLLSNNKTPWSWTVAEVTHFADLGSQSCDGNPSLVEENLPVWLDQQQICFWGYRVTQEVSPQEIAQGKLMSVEKKRAKD